MSHERPVSWGSTILDDWLGGFYERALVSTFLSKLFVQPGLERIFASSYTGLRARADQFPEEFDESPLVGCGK
ncbi:MAG: hypothetical protein HOM44_16830 [Gammaproteobacteria bacterium]|jgi:hypothetical protein|nr:hypothetical protein [Gammaproteobacteria bacterium]MBT5155753.1 hypothetical protein [Gammaproteobacteria bacterium]